MSSYTSISFNIYIDTLHYTFEDLNGQPNNKATIIKHLARCLGSNDTFSTVPMY